MTLMSILDIGRYRIGQLAWWAVFRHPDGTLVGNNVISGHFPMDGKDNWMETRHPKVLYEFGPFKRNWRSKRALPILCESNFRSLLTILTSDLTVQEFEICDIIRKSNTGEFIYSNGDDEWAHEHVLFDTRIAAEKERSRIIKMMRKWVESNKEE